MTDEHPGPDFLPYPMPVVAPPVPVLTAPAPAAASGSRWSRALDTVPGLGIVAIGFGLGALVLLVVVTFLADRPGPGAVVTVAAAVVSLVTGWWALRRTTVKDSRTLVLSAQSVGAFSAVLAAMVYAGSSSDDGGQPVTPPSPQPSASAPALPSPTPSPEATQEAPPAGATNGFGVPSTPGQPILSEPTALGTLLGHVVDTAGKPIAGAVITVTRSKPGDTSSTPQCPTRVTTLTGADGVYQLQLCQLGEGLGYHVVVQVGSLSAQSNLFVNSGNTTVYDVILPR